MEGKKSVAVLAAGLLIVVLLLSGQPPRVSGQAPRVPGTGRRIPYRECYDQCYSFCREHDEQPKFVCKVRCSLFKCGIGYRESEEVPAASAFAGEGSGRKEEDCLQLASVGSRAAATGGGSAMAAGPAGALPSMASCTGCDRRVKAKRV